MITVHLEKLHDCLEELKPLFTPHYEELALNQDKVPLDPQYEVYLEREARGEVLCAVVRESGRIIGYFVGFVAPALHYRTCLTLTQDIFWIHPQYRLGDSLEQVEGSLVAEQLFDCVKREALRRGVQRVYFGSKAHHDLSAMFARMGLSEVDVYFSAWWGT